MPYQKKPAPESLSKSQKQDWNMNEEARYQASLKQDKRSMDTIAPKDRGSNDNTTAAKSATATAKAGEQRNADTTKAVEEAKKMHNKGYFGK